MTIKNVMFLLLASLFIINCSNDKTDDLEVSEQVIDEEPDTETKVTYDADIKSIISSNCTNCHGNPPTSGAPTSYVTYSQVSGNINGIISRINSVSNPMPSSGLMPQSTRALIQQWKDDGLLEK